jgi:hypothetical protein
VKSRSNAGAITPSNRPVQDDGPAAGPGAVPSIPLLERVDALVAALAVDPEFARIAASAGGPAQGRTAAADRDRLRAPRRLTLHGEPVTATPRFWKSFFHAAGVNDNVFRLFSGDEVFARVTARQPKRQLRFTVEHRPGGERRLLGIAQKSSAMLEPRSALALLQGHGAEHLAYADGVVISRHVPADGPGAFRIGPDDFENRFALELPLDGFGEPRLFAMMLRLICANGAVGVQKAFRNSVRLGDDPWHALDRSLGSYANRDGFAAMRRRFESAQRSWASLEEIASLEETLGKIGWGGGEGAPSRRAAFERSIGDLPGIYGVASLNALTPKRRRLLPSRTRVYEAINFASELATHHAPPAAAMRLQAWIGATIADEFDLEGSAEELADFEALHMPTATSAPRNASARPLARGGRR